jgi:crotonobetaine/carnitine-CoA ligase
LTGPAAAGTLPELAAGAARAVPDQTFLAAEDLTVRYGELPGLLDQVAGALDEVDPDLTAPLAVGSRNLGLAIMCWWGQAWRGGVTALLHSALRGDPLARALALTESEVLVADAALAGRVLAERELLPRLRTLVLLEEAPDLPRAPGLRLVRWGEHGGRPGRRARVRPEDPCTIMFTSGTTGPAKGVLKSHRYETTYGHWAAAGVELRGSHTMWSCSPYAHTRTANATIIAAASAGARVVLGPGYRAPGFWADARAAGATHTLISSSLANRLLALPEADTDRQHGVEVVHCLPAPRDPGRFMSRFGVRLTGQGYGSTEIYAAPQQLRHQDWTRPPGFAGRAHPLVHAVVCDSGGAPVARDGVAVGELRARPMRRLDMFTEYYRDPAATARAFGDDGWFRTGDRFSWDDDGNLYFVGRVTDSIRHSGENVSAWEVETAASAFPGVAEAAAFGVPCDEGEQDIRLDLITDEPVDCAALLDHLRRRLPRFAVPRYLAFRRDFPRTPSGKVRKSELGAPGGDIIGEVFDRRAQR